MKPMSILASLFGLLACVAAFLDKHDTGLIGAIVGVIFAILSLHDRG